MSSTKKKWTAFENWGNRGPFMILIIDYEWWDANRQTIDDWFDRNCPICKPDPNDTIIRFNAQSQYAM